MAMPPSHSPLPSLPRNTPSFSSALLDSVYRSIDQTAAPPNPRRKIAAGDPFGRPSKFTADTRRAFHPEKGSRGSASSLSVSGSSSSSSSSDSSCSGGVFSTPETEFRSRRSKPRPSGLRSSPAGGGVSGVSEEAGIRSRPRQKAEGTFARTRARALKMYSDLKKATPPISPRGRLAAFLHSLFGSKKPAAGERHFRQESKPPLELTSPFSTACLSKETTSCSASGGGRKQRNDGTLSGGGRKQRNYGSAVQFIPVGVNDGEDPRPCGRKRLYGEGNADPCLTTMPTLRRDREIKNRASMERARIAGQVEKDAGRYFLGGFHEKQRRGFGGMRWGRGVGGGISGGVIDEDDTESCSSSDLFELDDEVAGIGRYPQELPVYGTTNLNTNHAIANGFVL